MCEHQSFLNQHGILSATKMIARLTLTRPSGIRDAPRQKYPHITPRRPRRILKLGLRAMPGCAALAHCTGLHGVAVSLAIDGCVAGYGLLGYCAVVFVCLISAPLRAAHCAPLCPKAPQVVASASGVRVSRAQCDTCPKTTSEIITIDVRTFARRLSEKKASLAK